MIYRHIAPRGPQDALTGLALTIALLLSACSPGATSGSTSASSGASSGAGTQTSTTAATSSPVTARSATSGTSAATTAAARAPSTTGVATRSTASASPAGATTTPSGANSTTTARPTATPRPPAATGSTAAAAPGDNWLTYYRTAARPGDDPASPPFQSVQRLWQSPQLDGDVYAEPLLDNGHLYIVTENDTIYSLDARTGQGQWQQHVASPMPGSSLPCGDIDPSGITSTPVIDPASGNLFAVAFEQPGKHELLAVDLATGAIRYRTPIDPQGANPIVQQQRSALAFGHGRVYVAYGGLDGDCGQYHGYVVVANAANGSIAATYQVPTQREGAIWAPAGPAIDGAGNLYVATGNGSSDTSFDYGDAVIKLSPDLKVLDWFAPTNWAELNRTDGDLGSLSPVLLPNGLLFQIGKSGEGYLLHTDHLGQIGGQAFAAPVCAGGGAFGAAAYSAGYIYVPCRNGLVAVKVGSGASFSVAWTGPAFAPDSPVVAGGVVWMVNPSRNELVGLDAGKGGVRFTTALPASGGLPHFIAPTVAAGTVYVAAGATVAAYR